MNAPDTPQTASLDPIATLAYGTAFEGGYLGGLIKLNGQRHAIIVAPKDEGEHDGIAWIHEPQAIAGALSYHDGYANTYAMAAAGSDLAKWANDLRIGGHADWHIPAQDALEVIYRNLKPTTRKNYCYARSGINLNAVVEQLPYTPEHPMQTPAPDFQFGGAQAFEEAWYWSSTQHAAYSVCAWGQDFSYGNQNHGTVEYEGRARAVRVIPV